LFLLSQTLTKAISHSIKSKTVYLHTSVALNVFVQQRQAHQVQQWQVRQVQQSQVHQKLPAER